MILDQTKGVFAIVGIALCTLSTAGVAQAQTSGSFMLGINSHANHAANPVLYNSVETYKDRLTGLKFNSYRDGYEWSWVQNKSTGVWQTFPGGTDPSLNGLAQVYADPAIRASMSRVQVLGFNRPELSGFNPDGEGDTRDLAKAATMAAFTTNFKKYIDFVLSHQNDVPVEAGKNQWFELWNEWNRGSQLCKNGVALPSAASSPAEKADWDVCTKNRSATTYATFLHQIRQYIKVEKGRSDIKLISQGLGDRIPPQPETMIDRLDRPWLKEFMAAGGMNDIDGLGIHVYDFNRQQSSERLFVLLNNAYSEVKTYPGYVERPWYITETGYPTYDGRTELDQALFSARFTLLARTLPFIKGLWLYDLGDDGNDPAQIQHRFGLLGTSPNNLKKTAYEIMGCLAGPATDATQANFTLVAGSKTVLQNGLYAVQYVDTANNSPSLAKHHRVTAIWSSSGTPVTVKITAPTVGTLTYAKADVRNRPCVTDNATEVWFNATNAATLVVGAQPVYLWQSLDVPLFAGMALSTN